MLIALDKSQGKVCLKILQGQHFLFFPHCQAVMIQNNPVCVVFDPVCVVVNPEYVVIYPCLRCFNVRPTTLRALQNALFN